MRFSTLILHAICLSDAATTASVLRDLQAPVRTASFDSQFGAPRCSGAATSCDSGPSLLVGRGDSGTPEQNHPNTIDGCSDGTGPVLDNTSVNRIIVRSGNINQADSSDILLPGGTATIIATVNCLSASQSWVEFFFASDATNPQWQQIGTLRPSNNGVGDVMISYTLPGTVGIDSAQAVRIQFRDGPLPPIPIGGTDPNYACSTGIHDDHDDLVFDVIHPSSEPSSQPSIMPSMQPSESARPSSMPSMQPSESARPSSMPSMQPPARPSSMPSTAHPSSTCNPVNRFVPAACLLRLVQAAFLLCNQANQLVPAACLLCNPVNRLVPAACLLRLTPAAFLRCNQANRLAPAACLLCNPANRLVPAACPPHSQANRLVPALCL